MTTNRYLAVDYGRKRIGLAVSAPGTTVVAPIETIAGRNDPARDAAAVAAAAAEYEPAAIVVGLPLNMDGSEGDEARRARRFADALHKATSQPVHLFDERLTSFDADVKMRDRELTRNQRRARRDALAATAILADFLAAGPPDGPNDTTR